MRDLPLDPESVCRQNGWRLTVCPPLSNNLSCQFVAQVHADDEAIGLGMSAHSALAASVYAVQSALRTTVNNIYRDEEVDSINTPGGSLEWDDERIEIEPRGDRL